MLGFRLCNYTVLLYRTVYNRHSVNSNQLSDRLQKVIALKLAIYQNISLWWAVRWGYDLSDSHCLRYEFVISLPDYSESSAVSSGYGFSQTVLISCTMLSQLTWCNRAAGFPLVPAPSASFVSLYLCICITNTQIEYFYKLKSIEKPSVLPLPS